MIYLIYLKNGGIIVTAKTNKTKKIIAIICAVIFMLGVISGIIVEKALHPSPRIKTVTDITADNADNIKFTAHRGLSALAPENTLAAFRLAGEYGFYAAECDVNLTKDGVWVISHDETVNRMTNGRGNISDYTYEQLQQFKVNAGNGIREYNSEKIPSLEQYLEVCADYNIVPEIEIKNGSNEKLCEILTLLDKYSLKDKAIIISFSAEKLGVIREADSDIELWYLMKELSDDDIALALEMNYAVAFSCSKTTDEMIKKAADSGLQLCSWTVDSTKRASKLCDAGVYYITTNSILPQSAK